MLTELSPLVVAPERIDDLAHHLRLSSGFGREPAVETALRTALEAAVRAVERRTGRVLVARRFAYRAAAWERGGRLTLPLAPVRALVALDVEDAEGACAPQSLESFALNAAAAQPRIVVRRGAAAPRAAAGGGLIATVDAGWEAWEQVPAELRQAAVALAAGHFEGWRGDDAACVVDAVAALLAPYRQVRL